MATKAVRCRLALCVGLVTQGAIGDFFVSRVAESTGEIGMLAGLALEFLALLRMARQTWFCNVPLDFKRQRFVRVGMAGETRLQLVMGFAGVAHGARRNCVCPQRRMFDVTVDAPHGRLVEAAVPLDSRWLFLVALYAVGIPQGRRWRLRSSQGCHGYRKKKCDQGPCERKNFAFHSSPHLPQIVGGRRFLMNDPRK